MDAERLVELGADAALDPSPTLSEADAVARRLGQKCESPGRILALCEGRGIRPGHSQTRAKLAQAVQSGCNLCA